MAARDDTLWSQKKLDFVFGLSCVAMLAAMVWMFAKDYYREFKPVQREGRDVEVAILNMQKLENENRHAVQLAADRQRVIDELAKFGVSLPDDTTDDNFTDRAKQAARMASNSQIQEHETKLTAVKLRIEIKDKHIASENAVRDSWISAQQIFLQTFGDKNQAELVKMREDIDKKVEYLFGQRKELEKEKAERANLEDAIAKEKAGLNAAIEAYDAEARTRDRLTRAAASKTIDWKARIRAWPIIDAFNSPYKIVENVPEGLTINYNFREVQRADRCATCHMFIDRPTPPGSKYGFGKESLRGLDDYTGTLRQTLTRMGGGEGLADLDDAALEAELDQMMKSIGKSDEDVKRMKDGLKAGSVDKKLTPSQVALYAHHPRLDLFVGSNSKHPIEKYACTICHSGQGGATEFKFAYHAPDHGKPNGLDYESFEEKLGRWEKDRKWTPNLHPDNMWDFPMHPSRFTESSCLKCHHHVTDLIRTDGKEEAPKLLKGYRLVRDLGCFGCHDIGGWKGGKSIGPEMRLEPYPAIDDLPEHQQARAIAAIDPKDPPGEYRKVGPGLRRLAEKSNEEFVRKWIRSPRDFRPGTKMPHPWGLSNNTREQLSDAHKGESQVPQSQAYFPDAEMEATAFYLLKASEFNMKTLAATREAPVDGPTGWDAEMRLFKQLRDLDDNWKKTPNVIPTKNHSQLPANASGRQIVAALLQPPEKPAKEPPLSMLVLTKDQLALVLSYLGDRERLRASAETVADRKYPPEVWKDDKLVPTKGGDAGLTLFKQKGCVACHTHQDVLDIRNGEAGESLADADFGPNLTNMADKLGNDDKAKKWLFFWLTDPKDHYSRTRMPNPRLEPMERLEIAEWLLSTGKGEGELEPTAAWRTNVHKVPTGNETQEAMKKLARVYLDKALTISQAEQALGAGLNADALKPLRPDADERILAEKPAADSAWAELKEAERIKMYVGKKTITRYGCFGCHDIPGFETARPIGTPLNDWGRKDSDRLDFGNIKEYLKDVHDVHAGHLDAAHYNPFFQYALDRTRRDGFLYQKLQEPRSFDYNKLIDRPWDDRLRMPQFKFAHTLRKKFPPKESGKPPVPESPDAYQERAAKEEEENLEAVMTFILGLVAENLHEKFIHQPKGDRLNEVKGIKLLEKFNCIGCHTVKPGVYEMSVDAIVETVRRQQRRPGESDASWAKRVREDEQKLEEARLGSVLLKDYLGDEDLHGEKYPATGRPGGQHTPLNRPYPGRFPVYTEHNAWRQQFPSPSGSVVIHGVPLPQDRDASLGFSVQIWEAVGFRELKRDGREVGEMFHIPVGSSKSKRAVKPQWLLQSQPPYGGTRFSEFFGRAVLVPEQLAKDMELAYGSAPPMLMREGQKVQPQWLVEFLQHPYEIRPMVSRRIRMPNFHMSETDAAALRDYFIAVDRLNNPGIGLDYTMTAPPQRSADHQQALRKEYLAKYKSFIKPEDLEKADYFEAGWRALTNTKTYCGQCHAVPGINDLTIKTQEAMGPALDRVGGRLRPEYAERYISAPGRIIPYTTMSPVIWDGYWDKDLPAMPTKEDEGTKRNQPLDLFYALPATQRARAVRDALFSWGYLSDPDKTPTYKAVKLPPPGFTDQGGH